MTDSRSPTDDPLTPTPDFARFLEWQVAAELRRATRFGAGGRSDRLALRRPLAAGVVLVAASLALGACGVLAVQDRDRRANAQVLCEQYQARFEVARARTAAAFAELEPVQQLAAQGLASMAEFEEKADRHLVAALEASLLGLDTIEVGHTGREPDRRLSAPLVAGRDLVRERLEHEHKTLEYQVTGTTRRKEHVEAQEAKGMVPAQELARARAAAAERERGLELVLEKLWLRTAFLGGAQDAVAVERAGLRLDANDRLARALDERVLAQEELRRIEQHAAIGRVVKIELQRARHALTERDAAVRLAEAELAALTPARSQR